MPSMESVQWRGGAGAFIMVRGSKVEASYAATESPMILFEINDMTCQHCVGVVTQTIAQLDPAARVEVDLARKQVRIDSLLERAALALALEDAGYTPV
jgi:copper chaperone